MGNDDNDGGGDDNDGGGVDAGQKDDDDDMEDQQLISSILKRKRTSSTSGSSSSQKRKLVTEEDISATMHQLEKVLKQPESSSDDAVTSEESLRSIDSTKPELYYFSNVAEEMVTEPETSNIIALPLSTTPATTLQITLPITMPISHPLTNPATSIIDTLPITLPNTLPATSTAIKQLSMSMPTVKPTEATAVTSDRSTLQTTTFDSATTTAETSVSTLLLSAEDEQEMVLKAQAEAETREEEERKRKLKEQSDADREFLLKLSGDEALERERVALLKEQQEAHDFKMAKLIQSLEDTEHQREEEAEKRSNVSKKQGGVNPSVERLWNEIDRKKYAARMTGRSHPAPITKVSLKKPKNKSQAQLLIQRGLERQSIQLDQVCKLHREEWNEIRLAIAHSSSSAKDEVLNEIDRLFQKMVGLQLLRPEDTIILGENVVRPPSPRYRSGTSSIHRVPNISKLNLSIPDGIPRVEGTETTKGEIGLVYRDLNGALRFQRESELEKIDHEQLINLIRAVSTFDKSSYMRKAIVEEAMARKYRYLPSTDKYELADALGGCKEEDIWESLK